MTRNPIRSHSCRKAVAGALCEQRIALQPSSFIRSSRHISSVSGTAVPTPAWSRCRHTPFSLTCVSLRKRPLSASKRIVRKPTCTRRASTLLPSRSRATATV
ncbi:hypothetical protein WR25_15735 [Diploscapter pachys]|uniref:Uncharacterized protein n=1 Tax=Diploscapter pachys TaxID=2018661 RepID=A0A2A2M548_9BILA|nr:hypothetical protein WR25_15735 [Diploscapter pachys]